MGGRKEDLRGLSIIPSAPGWLRMSSASPDSGKGLVPDPGQYQGGDSVFTRMTNFFLRYLRSGSGPWRLVRAMSCL